MDPAPGSPTGFRWQAFFHRAIEPLFLLNRQRRVLFVNRAWEKLTGLSAEQARGLVCSRRKSADPIARTLCPPPEVLQGKPGRVRRLFPGTEAGPPWWDLEFFPLAGETGLLGILGKVTVAVTPLAPPARPLPEAAMALRQKVIERHRVDLLANGTPVGQRLIDQVHLAAQTRVPVLLVGEAGTGKRWLARAIHFQSAACELPFVAWDCAALPASALALTLFGDGSLARPAAFGSLYLANLPALPRDFQGRLADWLDDPTRSREEWAPRLIAGSRSDLAEEVRLGRLIDELHHRLGVFVLAVPPLREQVAGLRSLVDRLLPRAGPEKDKPVVGCTPSAWEYLRAYSWPGNVRELLAVLRSASARTKTDQIDTGDLPAYLRQAVNLDRVPARPPEQPIDLEAILTQVETRLIRLALTRAKGNKSKAAGALRISRAKLLGRLKALKIDDTETDRS